jgi:hypothetical protein
MLINRIYAAKFSMTGMSPSSFFVVTTLIPLLRTGTGAFGISRTVPSWSVPSSATRSSEKKEQDLAIRVTLSDGNLATQTAFDNAGLEFEEKAPVGSSGPFHTVNLDIGAEVQDQDLRCQLVDTHGDVIELIRDGNEDFTFGDGGNGAWNFLHPESSEVGNIICNPTFVLG